MGAPWGDVYEKKKTERDVQEIETSRGKDFTTSPCTNVLVWLYILESVPSSANGFSTFQLTLLSCYSESILRWPITLSALS